jgi:hypothetical protein
MLGRHFAAQANGLTVLVERPADPAAVLTAL